FHHVAQHVLRCFLDGLVAIARNSKRRLVEFVDLFRQRAQPLVFRRRRQRPVDFGIVRRVQQYFVQAVLFIKGDFSFELQFCFFYVFQEFLDGLLFFEVLLLVQSALRQHFRQLRFFQPPSESCGDGRVFLFAVQNVGKSRS